MADQIVYVNGVPFKAIDNGDETFSLASTPVLVGPNGTPIKATDALTKSIVTASPTPAVIDAVTSDLVIAASTTTVVATIDRSQHGNYLGIIVAAYLSATPAASWETSFAWSSDGVIYRFLANTSSTTADQKLPSDSRPAALWPYMRVSIKNNDATNSITVKRCSILLTPIIS